MNKFGFMSQYMDFVEKRQDRKLVLFGAGANVIQLMSRYFPHDEITAIWDNDSQKYGKNIFGISVSPPPSEVNSNIDTDCFVVIITVSEELAISSIQAQLANLGVKHVYPQAVLSLMNEIERYNADFSKKFHELNAYKLIQANENKIQMVRNLLADDKSRYVYDAIVEKTKYNIDDYTDIADDVYEHYFSDGIFEYSDDEVLIDGGAFLGEDTIRFARIIGNKLKRSYCFEPDVANYEKCVKNLQKFFDGPEKFCVLKSGLWNANENVGFISYGTHASVFTHLRNISSSSKVSAVKIDDVIEPKDKVTLIKMDIEGAEIPALQGAENIIRRDKPKLAICIYHMIEDLWEIPLYIHSLVPEYKIYIRHHTTKFWDSVVYATI